MGCLRVCAAKGGSGGRSVAGAGPWGFLCDVVSGLVGRPFDLISNIHLLLKPKWKEDVTKTSEPKWTRYYNDRIGPNWTNRRVGAREERRRERGHNIQDL